MREGRDGEGEGSARTGLLRRRCPPPSPSPSSSSSPPVMEGKSEKSGITKAVRDRLSFSSSGARPSCWGSIGTRHPIGRSRSRNVTAGDEHGTPLTVTATIRSIPSSCVCISGNPCGCSSGKADAAGVRSLVERNDFYCQDCNTHK